MEEEEEAGKGMEASAGGGRNKDYTLKKQNIKRDGKKFKE